MWQVMQKELLELVRDKKTMFFIIALPMIIFPVIFGVVGFFASQAVLQEQQKVVKYTIVAGDQAPEFAESIFYHRDFQLVELQLDTKEARIEAIRTGQVDLVIAINEDFKALSEQSEQSEWLLYYNDSSSINMVRDKVRKVFDDFEKSVQKTGFEKHGIDEKTFNTLMKPIKLTTVNTADEQENIGEKIGGFIPYILIPLILTGAMYPAIDIGAGEKERGTLETLLLTPLSRFSIVMGKFLTILVSALATAAITVFSMSFWGYIAVSMMDSDIISRVVGALAGTDLVLIFVLLMPVAAFFAAILLAISIYAKSFKEAQNYMGPMSMLGFIPVMFAMLPGIELNSKWAFVPITNVALAIKEILKGTIDYFMLFAIFGSTIVFALASVFFCVHWFNKESVLFR